MLVVAAHPDDEVLGCGGTMALHAMNGDDVRVLIACEGESLRYGTGGVGQAGHIAAAAREIGIPVPKGLGFADQSLDTTPQTRIIAALLEATAGFEPHVVYCQSGDDVNTDHLGLFRAALVAFRPTASSVHSFLTWYTASPSKPHNLNPADTLPLHLTPRCCILVFGIRPQLPPRVRRIPSKLCIHTMF